MNTTATHISMAAFMAALALAVGDAHAVLTAYYSLDNLTTGIQNQGTDGATSDLTASGGGITVLADGIIGAGALHFNGASDLSATAAGNAADDLTAYPFTASLWLRNAVNDMSRDAAMGLSDVSAGSTYWNVGVGTNDAGNEAEMVLRNTTFTEVDATGSDVDSSWHHVMAVFNTGNTQQIYFDGKLANTGTMTAAFSTNVDTLSLGAFLRNGGTRTDPYQGDIDDAGLFDTAFVASDAALVNGIGRIASIGLDQLDEAQNLLSGPVGSTAAIGNYVWQHVDNLPGVAGDVGDDYIVTSNNGDGLAIYAVPEPSTLALAMLGLLSLGVSRQRPRRRA